MLLLAEFFPQPRRMPVGQISPPMRAGGITNSNIEISPFEIKRKLEIVEMRPYVQISQKSFNE
ncbi:MAG TPA: hypothetical protein DHU26_01470 [Spirochaetaceae bacterium]|nr:hypothetical protein [Spirochaetaceae bacterium]